MTTTQRHAAWIVFLAAGILLTLAAGGSAKEIKVPGDYSDLEKAIREAKPGDKVVITSSKTFRDNIVVRNARRLTITTSSRSRVATIQARRVEEPALSLSSCSDIVFENFIIQSGSYGVLASNCRDIMFANTTVQSASVGVSALNCRGMTFRDSLITMNIGSGLVGSGYVLDESTVSKNLGWGMEIIGDEDRIGELGAELTETSVSGNALGGVLLRWLRMEASETVVRENLGWGVEIADRGTLTMVAGRTESLLAANALGGVHVADATAALVARIADNGDVGALAERSVMDLAACTVSGHPGGNLLYRASTGSVSGSQILASPASGVDLQGASVVTLSGTTVSHNGQWGVRIDASSRLTVTSGSVISQNAPDGILIDGGGAAVLGSEIVANAQHGLLAQNGAQLSLGTSVVARNAVQGILLAGATLTLDRTEVTENGQDGVHAVAGSIATITNGSALSSNGHSGLSLDAATGALVSSTARGNQSHGLSGTHAAQLTIENSSVSQNLGEGVFLTASRADIKNAEIDSNAMNGIHAQGSSTIAMAGGMSRVTGNGQNGILVEESTATIADCKVSGNQENGVSAASGSQTAVRDSTVSDNEAEGAVATGATLTIENSTLRGNAANGIHVLARSTLRVGGGKTLITLNGRDGILVEDSVATVNDCEIVENQTAR